MPTTKKTTKAVREVLATSKDHLANIPLLRETAEGARSVVNDREDVLREIANIENAADELEALREKERRALGFPKTEFIEQMQANYDKSLGERTQPRYTVELTTEGWQILDRKRHVVLGASYGSRSHAEEGCKALNAVPERDRRREP